MAKVSAVKIQR